MIHELSLESLPKLDMGKVAEALQTHLKRAALDCKDRPGDDKPRKVLVEFSFKPVLEDDGDCSEVKGQVHISSVVPKHRTKAYSFGLRRNGSLAFNEDSPDNINQSTIFDNETDSE